MRPKLEGRDTAMRITQDLPQLSDDLPLEPLAEGIRQNIRQLKKRGAENLIFGKKQISKFDYILSLEHLLKKISSGNKDEVLQSVREEFEFFEIYGDTKWSEVFMTAYYDPVIKGSLKKTKELNIPLYRVPKDLVSVQMHEFFKAFPDLEKKINEARKKKDNKYVLRGRFVPFANGGGKVVPYYSREEIDTKGKLKKEKLEIVWVNPIDSFFIQIQGSGTVQLDNGKKIRVGYASQNGHGYVAIGKFLLDHIPLEKMSMQAIHEHLSTLPEKELHAILNKNPSYVFFQELEGASQTYFGTDVIAGRTIATDFRFFPKGAVAYLEFNQPVFAEGAAINESVPVDWKPTSRLVVDQDTGGAIRGAHRLDLYWGLGDLAARSAGVMRHHGKLWYLLPSESLLEKLKKVNLTPQS